MMLAFARETGAGRDRIILLLLDGAGWYTEPGLEQCAVGEAADTLGGHGGCHFIIPWGAVARCRSGR